MSKRLLYGLPALLMAWLMPIVSIVADDSSAERPLAIYGRRVLPVSGAPIDNGVVLIVDGRIAAIGPRDSVAIPEGCETLEGDVVTPGLVDVHSVVGLAGILNQDEDQDQLDATAAMQPQLRAIDAYNASDELIEWLRELGVTTLHTGHAPGQLCSGQTMIVRTVGTTVDEAIRVPARAISVTLAESAIGAGGSAPGTRGKAMALLRARLIAARERIERRAAATDDAEPIAADLELEAWEDVLERRLALMITAERAQDIASALRLQREFGFELWLDGASEAYRLIDEIREAEVPVLVHASMARATGERENLSFENAARLAEAGIPIAIQSGYEAYVPKTRVVLFEGAIAAANGLGPERALRAITLDPAKILGIADQVGSLEIGKRGDVAIFDGDPFEYVSHCVATIIDGKVVSRTPR